MATYLKRTSKMFDLSLSRANADVHLRDLMCPVCRGILIEPVTLPCTHNLCLRCLKGTFEHNSLSCPLCRLRVGSWLRTATKSETLVNHGLWELIRAKFPKEVEDKHNGEERDLGLLDADFAADRILSAAGEIHREYEAQLQMAEEEMRRQRKVEQMASEALIQKIQAEEQQHLLAQLAQDQLLAKTLAKKQATEKQVSEKQKEMKCYAECLNTSVSNYTFDASRYNVKTMHVNNVETPQAETAHLENRRMCLPESVKESSELRRTNMALLYKIRADKYNKAKANSSLNAYKDCPKQLAYNIAVTKTMKPQTVSKFIQPCTSNYSMDPGCSTSRAYVTETKEELRVPSDVVNSSKKKSLGVEVCTTHGLLGSHRTDDDERIGSAESSGSHDSINQEIHHFKPIKTVPRTSLKISSDGKQIDPKLIRVIPIMKRVINAVLKPPSPTHLKRTIGCSWSAFRGRARQDAKNKQIEHNLEHNINTETPIDQKPSTSLDYSQTVSNKSMKPQMYDARLDCIHGPSYDSNKNYTKDTNKIVNGTKVNKKLNDESNTKKIRKSWRTRMRNGIAKSKQHKYALSSKKGTDITLDVKDENEDDLRRSSSSFSKTSSRNNELDDDDDDVDDVAVENIAERIKRRKVNAEKKTSKPEMESDVASKRNAKKSSRKRVLSEGRDGSPVSRSKRRKVCEQSNIESLEKSDSLTNATSSKSVVASVSKRSARNANSTKISSKRRGNELDGARDRRYNSCKYNYDSPPESCDETEKCVSEEGNATNTRVDEKCEFSDDEVIEEQQRIERLLLQEREDFELARRLQAKFDEMERIAGRTRRSRRTVEDAANINAADLREIGVEKTMRKVSSAPRTAKRSSVVRRANVVSKKKRGRPPKRVKQDDMCAR